VGKACAWMMLAAVAMIGCAGAPAAPDGAQTAGAASAPEAVQIPTYVRELRPGVIEGYLTQEEAPDSAVLLPPPPAEGSVGSELDQEASAAALLLRGTPRWDLAADDSVVDFPAAAATFSCALDLPVTAKETPNLYMLLRRSMADAGRATAAAKIRYDRDRPFEVNRQPICTPRDRDFLKHNGSYPSGHAATGWAWALILTELAPERSNAILARGLAYSESRVICNVHWSSDAAAGRVMGAAAVARMHGDPVFRAQLEKARAEIAALRAAGSRSTRDCAAEASALSTALAPASGSRGGLAQTR
jgi:acid phosphatase (class A)